MTDELRESSQDECACGAPRAECSCECEGSGKIVEGMWDDLVEKECLCVIVSKMDNEPEHDSTLQTT